MKEKTGRKAREYRQIPCPKCLAPVDAGCVTRNGSYRTGYHVDRVQLWRDIFEDDDWPINVGPPPPLEGTPLESVELPSGDTFEGEIPLCPRPKIGCWMSCTSVDVQGCQFCNFCSDTNCELRHPGAYRQ